MLEQVRSTQPQIADILSCQLENHDLPSTMLFSGPRFSGKMHCAYQLARELSSVKEGSLAISSNRDFQYQIDFAIECFRSSPTVSTCDFLTENMDIFLAQFHNALATDDRDQKSYDCAAQIMELMQDIRKIPSEKLDSWASSLSSAFQDTLKALGSQKYQKKNGILTIDQVRSIQEWSYLTNMGKGKKTIILEGIEDANESTRNSLLKILEEPPEGTVFILITQFPERVMNTILSRTRRYLFSPISSEAKCKLLRTLGQTDSNSSESLEDFFINSVSSKVPELNKLASGFINDPDFDLLALISKVEETKLSGVFFKALASEVEDEFRSGRISAHKASAMLGDISSTASRAEVFNQNPKLTIEGLFYQLRDKELR